MEIREDTWFNKVERVANAFLAVSPDARTQLFVILGQLVGRGVNKLACIKVRRQIGHNHDNQAVRDSLHICLYPT